MKRLLVVLTVLWFCLSMIPGCINTDEFDSLSVPGQLEVPPVGDDLLALNVLIHAVAKFVWYWAPHEDDNDTWNIQGVGSGSELEIDGTMFVLEETNDFNSSTTEETHIGTFAEITATDWVDSVFATHQENCYQTSEMVMDNFDGTVNAIVNAAQASYDQCTNAELDNSSDCNSEGYIWHSPHYSGLYGFEMVLTGTTSFKFVPNNARGNINGDSYITEDQFDSVVEKTYIEYNMTFDNLFFSFSNLRLTEFDTGETIVTIIWVYSGELTLNGQKYLLNSATQRQLIEVGGNYCTDLELQ